MAGNPSGGPVRRQENGVGNDPRCRGLRWGFHHHRVARPQRSGPYLRADARARAQGRRGTGLLNGAAEAAAKRSYALILIPPDAEPDSLDAFVVDGAILVDPRGDEPFFSCPWDSRPLVTTGRPIRPSRDVPVTVDNDLSGAAELMIDHLVDQGYRRPAMITTDTSRSYTSDMLAGYAVDSGALQLTSPQITGMFVYPRDVGREAASALIDLVEGRPVTVRTIEIPVRLNVRDSTTRG